MYILVLLKGFILGLLCYESAAVKMNLDPTNVVTGAASNDPNYPVPTTSTQYLTMECTPEGTGLIDTIYSLYIKRKRLQDTSYITFAVIEGSTNQAALRDNAPSDIIIKNPVLDGQINNNNVFSSVLRVRFLVSSLDCLDEASYMCEMNYLPINVDSTKVSITANLQVTALPGNLVISGAVWDGFFTNPIQNLTMLQSSRQYEFQCTGETGNSQATLINWYYKIPPYQLNMFQQVSLTNPSDNIDQGYPSTTICPYSRTTKLRYTPATLTQDLIVRCEVRTQTNTGAQVSAVSHEFHLTTMSTSSSSIIMPLTSGTIIMVLTAMLAMVENHLT